MPTRSSASGGADVAHGRQQDGLLRRVPQTQWVQALPGAGESRGQASVPGLLRHRRGGGAVRRAVAGGAGGSGGREGSSNAAPDERGGTAAGAGGGVDAARGQEHDGLLRRDPH
eukprot:scaffold115256_cov52-Phaeocystis_antarctica.AAC.1